MIHGESINDGTDNVGTINDGTIGDLGSALIEVPQQAAIAPSDRPFHIMTKPVGPICNLDCKYCFYLEKENLYPDHNKWRMPEPMLEEYIRQYIGAQPIPEVSFAWQGGEPTLLGVDFFRKIVSLQQKYADGKKIGNAIQTNGTLLDDEWCEFLSANQFLVGLSIDGPHTLHDHYRVDKQQRPTFDAVMRGLSFLKKHKTEFNTLTVVNRVNSRQPMEVYEFLKEIGSGFIQFIPLVERKAGGGLLKVLELDYAAPPVPGEATSPDEPVTAWSVEPRQYGDFLCCIFNQWVRQDVGKVFVQIFDVALGQWLGAPTSLCVFAEKCGSALALEHNGDLYACDHYVYPQYKLGNLLNQSLGEMVQSDAQKKFGNDKADTLPDYCRKCEYRFACNGECPKHRFMKTPDGEPNLNYLCPAYKRFFKHVDPFMKTMADLLRANQPAAAIMRMLANEQQANVTQSTWATATRNDPCPCGSGQKYKKCCWDKQH